MAVHFTKMHGCGNDYVYVNGFTEQVSPEEKPAFVRAVSDRHFGIGSDGVIFINPGTQADFEMEMWNADGTRAEMCGNGIRCVAKYVYDHGMAGGTHFTIESFGKVKVMEVTAENGLCTAVRVDMGEPILSPALIPVTAEGDRVVSEPLSVAGRQFRMTCVSMGNPHCVIFEDPDMVGLAAVGPLIEHHPRFPKRTNVEFVRVLSRHEVRMRVWERGTGETLACGTGCCATAVACVLNGLTEREITVHVLGGDLLIEWDEKTGHVFMTGPATTVFEGEIATW